MTFPFAAYAPSLVCQLDLATDTIPDTAGRLVVVVTDTFGDGLPEATVTLTRSDAVAEILADASGRGVAAELESGNYRISAELPGFVRGVAEPIEVHRGCTTALVMPLRLVDTVA